MQTLGTGGMSRASGLSLKALRLYDASGLLVPAEVDGRTGYRRYAPEQLERARSIAALRRAELPLALIGELLDAPADAARARLLAWWAAEREGFARRSRTVELLAASASAAASAAGEACAEPSPEVLDRVRVESLPDLAVASISRTVEQPALVPSFLADVVEIRRHLAEEGAEAGPAHWVIFHDPVGDGLPGRIETAVPFTGRARPGRDIVLRVEPGAEHAVVDLAAREVVFPELLRFYDAVHVAAGLAPGERGRPPREWYPGAWPDDPQAIAVRIARPIPDSLDSARESLDLARGPLDSAPGADSTMSP
ncbi:MerR family transcriptional regulator [Agromyces lapidis]|uniref:MerR family transcriptional regulator n=1 Tax=Agromyces lapidis TaxID=279574 RepID=A0ABV5SQ14_9MICO|nr:MerR family transcriptional regulator [Agromyces lapidis]